MKKTLTTFLAILFLLPTALAQDKIKIIDQYIQKAQKEWKVPGLAIAIVKDGEVLLSKGYGIRTLGKKDKVDAQTLFGVMSTTKAMTAVGMGLLIDQGRIKWTDKVIQHLPHFKVADPYVTRELTIKDLFTHNSGVGNADYLWTWGGQFSNDEILQQMQYVEPVYSFRDGFIYQNIMYLVAGEIIENISGQTWADYTQKHIFQPLGMNNTFSTLAESINYENRTAAHYEINGRIQIINELPADPIAPAGSVWSTADDIAKWVYFNLTNQDKNGQPLLNTTTFNTIFKPQVMVSEAGFYPTIALTKPHWLTYGLGWFQHDYRGEMVNFHTGSLPGRTAIIGLLKDKNLGVYIFGNLDHAEVRHALMYKVFDVFGFDDNSRDWSIDLKKLYAELGEKGAAIAKENLAKRVKDTQPSHDLKEYVGDYVDPFYGTVSVTLEAGELKLDIAQKNRATLSHWHFDTFQAKWMENWMGESLISFTLNPVSGAIESIKFWNAKLQKVANN